MSWRNQENTHPKTFTAPFRGQVVKNPISEDSTTHDEAEDRQALARFREAAEQGDPTARVNLGYMCVTSAKMFPHMRGLSLSHT